jgi:hypothetical protein
MRIAAPLMSLSIPAATLAVAALLWSRSPCSGTACADTSAGSWILGAWSLPTALLAGAPFRNGALRYAVIATSSTAMWCFIGYLALRRATLSSRGAWRSWWYHYLNMVAGIWVGITIAAAALIYAIHHQILI